MRYIDILDKQEAVRQIAPDHWLSQVSPATFSGLMQNYVDPGNDYSLGEKGGFVKNMSAGVERAFRDSMASELAGRTIAPAGRFVDFLRGQNDQKYETLARGVGETLPRGIAQTGMVLGGAALTGTGFGSAIGVPLMAAGAGDAAASVYTDTDSVGQALFAGGTTLFAPQIGGLGAKAGLRMLPKSAVASPLARFGAAELGTEAAFLATDAGQQLIAGENPLTPENLFANALGNLAFSPISIAQGVKAYREGRRPASVTSLSIPRTGVGTPTGRLTGEGKAQFVDNNNPNTLFNWLVGGEAGSDRFWKLAKAKKFDRVLQETGMVDPRSGPEFLETFGKRTKGREFVRKAAKLSPDDPMVTSLSRRAAKLLETDQPTAAAFVEAVRLYNTAKDFRVEPIKGDLPYTPTGAEIIPVGQVANQSLMKRLLTQAIAVEGSVPEAVLRVQRRLAAQVKYMNEAPPEAGSTSAPKPVDTVPPQTTAAPTTPPEAAPVPVTKPKSVAKPASVAPKPAPVALKQPATEAKPGAELEPSTQATRTGERTMLQVFDFLGIDDALKPGLVATAKNLLHNMGIAEDARIFTSDDPAFIPTARQTLPYYKKNDRVTGTHVPGITPTGVPSSVIGIRKQGISWKQATPEETAHFALRTLAHEVVHGVFRSLDYATADSLKLDKKRVDALRDARAFVKTLTREKRADMIYQLQHTFFKNVDEATLRNQSKYYGNNPEEFITEFAANMALGLYTQPKKLNFFHNFLATLPESIAAGLRAVFRTMGEVVQAARAALPKFEGHKNQKALQDIVSKNFDTFVANIETLIEPTKIEHRSHFRMQQLLKPKQKFDSDIGQADFDVTPTGVKAMDEYAQGMKPAGRVQMNVAQHQQMASSVMYRTQIPAYQSAISVLTTLRGAAQNFHHAIRGHYMVRIAGGFLRDLTAVRDGKLTKEQLRLKSLYHRFSHEAPMIKGFSQLALDTNILVANAARLGEAFPTWDHPTLKATWSKYSQADQAALREFYDATLDANRVAAGLLVSARNENVVYDLAATLLAAGNKHGESERAARALFNALSQNQKPDDAVLNMPGIEKAMTYWEKIWPQMLEFQELVNRPYFTESRTGRYLVRYEVAPADGVEPAITGARSANTKAELRAIEEDIAKQGYKITESVDRRNLEYNEFDVVPTYLLERAAAVEEARYKTFLDMLEPDLAEQIKRGYIGGEGIREQIAGRQGVLGTRSFAHGRESLNMVAAQNAYAEIVSNMVAKQMQQAKFRWLMKHEDWNKDTRLKHEVQEFGNSVLNAGRQEFQTFRKAVTASAMGLNVSTAFVDSTQPITMGVHRLAEHVGYLEASKYVAEAYLNAFKNNPDPEFQKILVRADEKGLLLTGARLDEFITTDDISSYNVVRDAGGKDLISFSDAITNHEFMAGKVFDAIKNLGNKAFSASMIPMSVSAQINNKTMLYAGYKVGKKLGLKDVDLYNFAENMMQVVNLQGARASHSSFKLKAGKGNELVATATMLTNYPIAAFSQMYGNYRSMLKSSGLAPDVRAKAAKVFAGQLLTQFAFAGVMGFGLDALFKLSEKWFGYSPEEEIRTNLAAIDSSGLLGDVLLRGAMNHLTGLDISSRYSLSGVAGFNGYTGFDARGLFGPAGSFWSNLTAIPGQIRDNAELQNFGLLPTGLRKLVSGIKGTPITDKSGQTLMQPEGMDRLMYALGFRPDELERVQSQRSLLKTVEDLTTADSVRKTKERIKLIEEGDFGTVLDSVALDMERLSTELANLGLPPQQIQEEIQTRSRRTLLELVEATLNKVEPLDPMREGSLASAARRSAVAQSFGNRLVPRTSELARDQKKTELLSQLGLEVNRRRPKSLQRAFAIDQILAQNPQLSRQEAEMLLDAQGR